ncbi:MAG: hypothetical protein KKE77_04460 [Alphaproteobacteria bacterium]|jgi:hypothetical protein|nr:hypothetical protein [Alphaproteobacteria bacterium]
MADRQRQSGLHRVCWHLEAHASDDEADDRHAEMLALLDGIGPELLKGAAFETGHANAEIWDEHFPSQEWLEVRIQEIAQIADGLKLLLEAWSYEPRVMRRGAAIPQVWFDPEDDDLP